MKRIKTALVSVFYRGGLEALSAKLHSEGVKFLLIGGTQRLIELLGCECQTVESVTSYPSILGERVEMLHPKVFDGTLTRHESEDDYAQMQQYNIPAIDLVMVDPYPFEETAASGASEQEIIEKADIGGISLICAGAKNFNDVVIMPSKNKYGMLQDILEKNDAQTTLEERKQFAECAFGVSSHYDATIHQWFTK